MNGEEIEDGRVEGEIGDGSWVFRERNWFMPCLVIGRGVNGLPH
jgi:hypothetical protein